MRTDALEQSGAVCLSMCEGQVALQERPVHRGLSCRQMPQEFPAVQRGLVRRLVGRRVVERFVGRFVGRFVNLAHIQTLATP